MGYLTTVTFYNDGVHLLKENQKEFCDTAGREPKGHLRTNRDMKEDSQEIIIIREEDFEKLLEYLRTVQNIMRSTPQALLARLEEDLLRISGKDNTGASSADQLAVTK